MISHHWKSTISSLPSHQTCSNKISLSFVITLSLILILAGDIETNPGPIKMNDQPTVDMLMSFFLSVPNWKLIVILLPEVKYVDYLDVMKTFENDVAKQQQAFFTKWLSVCDYASWKDVIDVLKVKGEHTLIQHFKESFEQQQKTSKIMIMISILLLLYRFTTFNFYCCYSYSIIIRAIIYY